MKKELSILALRSASVSLALGSADGTAALRRATFCERGLAKSVGPLRLNSDISWQDIFEQIGLSQRLCGVESIFEIVQLSCLVPATPGQGANIHPPFGR